MCCFHWWVVYVEDPHPIFWTTVGKRPEGTKRECAQPRWIIFTERVPPVHTEHYAADLSNGALNLLCKVDIVPYLPGGRSPLSDADSHDRIG